MAKNDDIKNRISIGAYGIGTQLGKDLEKNEDIVKQTAMEVASHFGKRIDNKIIDTVTGMNLSNLFLNSKADKESAASKKKSEIEALHFKEMMQENSQTALSMIGAEQDRINNYANYRAICDNITECSLAKDTYVANILSPDDYTKTIFDIQYKDTDSAVKDRVIKELKAIIENYKLEEMVDEFVDDCVVYGDCFISVLPYDKEIGKFLAQTRTSEFLNESVMLSEGYRMLEEQFSLTERNYYTTLTESMINEDIISDEEREVMLEAFGKDFNIERFISDTVNNKIKIRSVTELLRNTAEMDNDILFQKRMVETDNDVKDKKKNSNPFGKEIKLNGAVIEKLDASKMVEIKVNGVIYGYYYVTPGFDGAIDKPSDAHTTKLYDNTPNPMNPSIYKTKDDSKPGENSSIPAAQNFNISDEKMHLISGVLLKALSKKLNKNFINDNKQFKDLLYSLLKQKYILEKGVSITYFLPEEIVHLHVNSIFSKIVFFAKIYLAILTNTVVIKLGRGHDKRIFYVSAGSDMNHEQAIMKLVQDVKTKEFKMSSLGSISSILSLNPGAFDDLYMAVAPDGTHPVDIDVIQGMDQDINNEFMEFLRRSMIEGTGLPLGLLEAQDNIEFARQISSQNAFFSRRIVQMQKKLTPGFTQLIRLLYKYEHQHTLDGKVEDEVDINNITIKFPSPGALNLTNTVDKLTQVDTAADYIAKTYCPDRADQSNMDEQQAFKMKIIQQMLPEIDWEMYKNMYSEFKDEFTKNKLIDAANNPPQPEDDGYGY